MANELNTPSRIRYRRSCRRCHEPNVYQGIPLAISQNVRFVLSFLGRMAEWKSGTLQAASFLRNDAYTRFESYMTHYLDISTAVKYNPEVKKIIENVKDYLTLLNKSYEDFDETRTAELQLIITEQKELIFKYCEGVGSTLG
jgi:hypothetical protein